VTLPELRAALEATCPKQCHTENGVTLTSICVPLATLQLVREAAEKHLATLPKTKMVEVWHVEWALSGLPMLHLHYSKEQAEEAAAYLAREPHRTCIRVTGPHQQEIPA
jgi:hypothetical protein